MKAERLWHQMPDEPAAYFDYFLAYLNLGYKRSLVQVPARIGKSAGYVNTLKDISRKWNWVARCKAFDEWELASKVQAREQAVEEARQRYVDALAAMSTLVLQLATNQVADIDKVPPRVRLKAALSAQAMAGLVEPHRVEMTGKGGKPLAFEEVERERSTLEMLHQDPEAAEAIKLLAFKSAAIGLEEKKKRD